MFWVYGSIDWTISPILLYASEVWGFENKESIEKVHLQFCKNILKVRSATPNYMVYGELGRHPMEVMVKRKDCIILEQPFM